MSMVRVLGQTDRAITTLSSHPEARYYPRVEKLALITVDKTQTEAIKALEEGGYFIDSERRVVIVRVIYRQHKYDANNVRQDRALSVAGQEIIHPLTGQAFTRINIIKDTYSLFLRLNDIVRGEYNGRIVYKRNEIVENTDTHEKKLKFLYAWLSKHQRRIISYSDEFYSNVVKVMDNYLLDPNNYEDFSGMQSGVKPVPLHLRNPSTRLQREWGFGKGYKYPHAYPEAWVEQDYLPEELVGRQFYTAKDQGQEPRLAARLARLRRRSS